MSRRGAGGAGLGYSPVEIRGFSLLRNLAACTALLVSLGAPALAVTVEVGELPCLPKEQNAAVTARVLPEVGGSSVRLYFRRLNHLGADYYVEFMAAGDGEYWSVFPKPEDRRQGRLTDEWWERLRDRDWVRGREREWLEGWMAGLEYEASEYWVAVLDARGEPLGRSEVRVVEVREPRDCPSELSPRQRGWAQNLTVGETVESQVGGEVFHWLCDGVVTRIGADGVLRADEYCRACVVAALPMALPLGAGVVAGELVDRDPAAPASPDRP